MAEAFANHYGGDVLTAASAGLAPTPGVARNTVKAMQEMNIDVARHVPRLYNPVQAVKCDLVVNLTGSVLPGRPPREELEWDVADPYGASLDAYRAARSDIEQRVMRLILDLRRQTKR